MCNQRISKIIFYVMLFLLGMGAGGVVANCQNNHRPEQEELDFPGDNEIIEMELTLEDHISLIVPEKLQKTCWGIIQVESEGDSTAFRKSGNCLGILQITPIYVKECNRLQDTVVYTLKDRTSVVKSLQMFVIYQNHHNPSHDRDKAIKVHNPTAGPEYRHKVLHKMN